MRSFLAVLLAMFLGFCPFVYGQDEGVWVPAAIHFSTTVSDGNLSLGEVVKVARERGIKVIIPTDRDFMKWEYGLWPLRHIIKKTREMNSVFKYGVDNYLALIELESRKNPDIVIIPGIESAPFYYWRGFPLSGDFRILDWHKHILVIGLDNAQDYRGLPVLSNAKALRGGLSLRGFCLLGPVSALLLGLILLRKREFSYKDAQGRELGRFSKAWRAAGIVIIAISALFLFNSFPSCPVSYDQYSPQAGARPYQILIDYVNRRGGLTFWAHPEAEFIDEQQGVRIETRQHVGDLWQTDGFTGFAIFYEGYEKVGRIGGEWDHLLRGYCEGRRKSPVWVLAGLAFDHGTTEDLAKALADVQTFILTKSLTREAVLDAMRQGRMYVSRGAQTNGLRLRKFAVKDGDSESRGTPGDEVRILGKPVIEISADFSAPQNGSSEAEIRLVRNAEVIETFQAAIPFDIAYEDEGLPAGRSYYRIEIKNGSQLIVTNPIFVSRKT